MAQYPDYVNSLPQQQVGAIGTPGCQQQAARLAEALQRLEKVTTELFAKLQPYTNDVPQPQVGQRAQLNQAIHHSSYARHLQEQVNKLEFCIEAIQECSAKLDL